MKKLWIIIIAVIVAITAILLVYLSRDEFNWEAEKDVSYMIPRVLFLTTGTESGNGELSEGVIIALQTFNGKGAYVQLATRDVLWDPQFLKGFNIMILHTSIGYHDADRRYSLTYMSDAELKNIYNWVKNGGVLIAGDNVGRNTLDAVDRISLFGQLTPENWKMADCFGVVMEEKNMKGYYLEGNINEQLKGTFIDKYINDHWVLVTDSFCADECKILAWYRKGDQKYPAFLETKHNKGLCYLLPTSYLLHPSNEGGYWSSEEISHFYDYVLDEFYNRFEKRITLNPWPDANDYAFCVTLNAAGEKEQYKRIIQMLNKQQIEPTIFVDGQLSQDVRNYMLDNKINLQSNAFRKINFRELEFPQTMNEIMQNEFVWDREFNGFRFPFTRNSAWGMICLEQKNYCFDSSIGADNMKRYSGSVFPYHIPVSNNNYYKILNVLEISPILHDDYFFFKDLLNPNTYLSEKMMKDAELYNKYLHNYLEYAVKPYHGAMVFLGHPFYSGYNDTTISPLQSIIETIKSENVWITTIEELAKHWNKFGSMKYQIFENKNETEILVCSENNMEISNATLLLNSKPSAVELYKGKSKVIKKNNGYCLIFDAFNGQKIKVRY